jgi:hypothetical protein
VLEVDKLDADTPGGPAAFVDTNGEVRLDADGLRGLVSALLNAAEQLDQPTGDLKLDCSA